MAYADPEKQKAAQRRHYENNKAAYLKRAKDGKTKARQAVREFVWNYLEAHACVDCGERDAVVLEFDHQGGKEFAIGTAGSKGYSLDKVKAEIEKCEVRCANCHRRRTARQGGWHILGR